jgi:hypothetical protein
MVDIVGCLHVAGSPMLHNLDLWATSDKSGATIYANNNSTFDKKNNVEKVSVP